MAWTSWSHWINLVRHKKLKIIQWIPCRLIWYHNYKWTSFSSKWLCKDNLGFSIKICNSILAYPKQGIQHFLYLIIKAWRLMQLNPIFYNLWFFNKRWIRFNTKLLYRRVKPLTNRTIHRNWTPKILLFSILLTSLHKLVKIYKFKSKVTINCYRLKIIVLYRVNSTKSENCPIFKTLIFRPNKLKEPTLICLTLLTNSVSLLWLA